MGWPSEPILQSHAPWQQALFSRTFPSRIAAAKEQHWAKMYLVDIWTNSFSPSKGAHKHGRERERERVCVRVQKLRPRNINQQSTIWTEKLDCFHPTVGSDCSIYLCLQFNKLSTCSTSYEDNRQVKKQSKKCDKKEHFSWLYLRNFEGKVKLCETFNQVLICQECRTAKHKLWMV